MKLTDIDAIYCINLHKRPDRLISFKTKWGASIPNDILPTVKIFKAIDADDPLTIIPSHWKGACKGAWGCLTSHQKVIEDASINRYKTIWILEDDVLFCNNFFDRLKQTCTELPEDWDLFYLGANFLEPAIPVSKYIAKSRGLTTHSYLLNDQHFVFHKIVEELKQLNIPIDNYYYSNLQPTLNTYFANPRICGQEEGFSDILKGKRNYSQCLGV